MLIHSLVNLRGEISALNPSISASRTVIVQATFRNQDERLRPGMFVKVAVELPDPQQLVAIPSSHLLLRTIWRYGVRN